MSISANREGVFAAAVGVILVAVFLITICCYQLSSNSGLKNERVGSSADVRWYEIGAPMTASCWVTDSGGNPMSDIKVHVVNNSGGGIATTASDGSARISLDEVEVNEICVNEVDVLNRPNANWRNNPSVANGLTIRIIIKDKRALGITNSAPQNTTIQQK